MGRMAGRRGGADRMVAVSLQAVFAVLCVLAAYIEICDAAAVVDVYRLIQYDLRGAPFGSRRAVINHHAISGLSVPGSDLARQVVILPIDKANVTSLNDHLQRKKNLGGLLLILPRKLDGNGDSSGEAGGEDPDGGELTSVAALEQWLIHNTIPYPVYFTFADNNVNTVLEDVQQNDASGRPATATTGGYKLVIPVSEAKKLPSASLTNIQGWLWGSQEGDVSVLPTIAIVASYDTFGAAPALAVGSGSTASGVVTLLELARLFSRLYSNPKTRGPYNLLFGLTSGGPYNYNGTARWLRGFDQRVRETIDYALCLNRIGSDRLLLHVSKPPDNAQIKQIHDGLSEVAAKFGTTVDISHKKINMSDSRVAWEHEQFSKERITAATLSELDAAPDLLNHVGGISERGDQIDEAAVVRNVKIIAESIARHIYGNEGKNVEVFADGSGLAVSPLYVRQWLSVLCRTPRVAPFLGKTAVIINALQKELAHHTKDVSLQYDSLDGTFLFYDTTTAKLSIYQVASVTFDLFIMLAVGLYLVLLFVILVISTKGVDDLMGVFRRPPSRKLKSA